jgi:anti-sigma factor RsiW
MEHLSLCSETRFHLPLFVGGDLDPAPARALEHHLRECAACSRAAREAQKARAALVGLAAATPVPADLWPGVRRELAAAGLLGPAPSPVVSRRRPIPVLWLSAAAALLICALGVYLGRAFQPGRPGPEPAPAPALALPAARPTLRPVPLQPLDPEQWPEAVSPSLPLGPDPLRPSLYQAASGRLGIH